METKHI